MRLPALLALLIVGVVAGRARAETCYELAESSRAFGKAQLCLEAAGTTTVATLREGAREVARLQLILAKRARCRDCNIDVFRVEGSAFTRLELTFNGTRNRMGEEHGTVTIFGTRFHYRTPGTAWTPPARPSRP